MTVSKGMLVDERTESKARRTAMSGTMVKSSWDKGVSGWCCLTASALAWERTTARREYVLVAMKWEGSVKLCNRSRR